MINIAKFLTVVILLASCDGSRRMPRIDAARSPFAEPRVVGELPAEIDESSGLAASLCQDGVLWTHNDAGAEAIIYAIDTRANFLGVWRVDGADNQDWEDMSTTRDADGKCVLYLGDIGNTNSLRRDLHRIYRVNEPQLLADQSNKDKSSAAITESAAILEFRYPDGNYDSEAMVVHQESGNIYVLIKEKVRLSAVYTLRPEFGLSLVQTARKIADFSVPSIPSGLLTGASISPDARSVVVCDYAAAYEIRLPENATNFDEIWKQAPRAFSLGRREQGEAITYSSDGMSVFATSEKKGAKLIEVRRAQARTE